MDKTRIMRTRMMCIGVLLLTAAGCRQQPKEYRIYGLEIVELDSAFERDVDRATVQVHKMLADWVQNDDGSKTDASYVAGSKTYNKEDPARVCSISHMQFKTADGAVNRLETYRLPDSVMVVCESDNQDATIALRNALTKALNQRGFHCAN